MIKVITFYSLTAVLLFLSPFSSIKTGENTGKSRYAKDHIIVKLRNNLPAITSAGNSPVLSKRSIIAVIAEELNMKVIRIKNIFPPSSETDPLYDKYGLDKYYTVYLENTGDVQRTCSQFEENAFVEFAEPDFIGEGAGSKSSSSPLFRPNDEYFFRQWALYNDGTSRTTSGRQGKEGSDMNVLKGWEIETGSTDIIIAILDSGTKLDHPDLSERIWINTKEKKNNRDDDGNGYTDDIYGWNFAYENSNVQDDGGHGTNICGTIGASTNNSIGYAGLDQNCRLMICKNLDDENLGEYSWWAASLYYAARNGANVINMSEGGYDFSKTLANAISYTYGRGCLIVASMMNKNNDDIYYPASLPEVFAVGATDVDDSRCRQFTWGGGSNWGRHISVVAPGNRIYGLDYKDNYNYDVYWSGTSQATAYVSGIASLLLAQDRSRTNKTLKEIITFSAKDEVGDPREDTPGWDEYYGYGRVDLFEALRYKLSPADKLKYEDQNNKKENTGNKQEDTQAKSVDRKSDSSNEKEKEDGKKAIKADN